VDNAVVVWLYILVLIRVCLFHFSAVEKNPFNNLKRYVNQISSILWHYIMYTALYSAWRWLSRTKHVVANYLNLWLIKVVIGSICCYFNYYILTQRGCLASKYNTSWWSSEVLCGSGWILRWTLFSVGTSFNTHGASEYDRACVTTCKKYLKIYFNEFAGSN